MSPCRRAIGPPPLIIQSVPTSLSLQKSRIVLHLYCCLAEMEEESKIRERVKSYLDELLEGELVSVENDSRSTIGIKVLLHILETSTAATVMGLQKELEDATQCIVAIVTESQEKGEELGKLSSLALESGCQLFVRHVSRTYADFVGHFEECKAMLAKRGERFAELSERSRSTIARLGHPFIRHNSTVLVHGMSKVASSVLLEAARAGKQFSVMVTECSPDRVGVAQAKLFSDAGIPVTVVSDAAVASVMDKVDVALVGAEAVVESGGIVNRTGTFQIGIMCSAFKKPLYVAVESYKFARLYPLNQSDLPASVLQQNPGTSSWQLPDGATAHVPRCDFTPSEHISLLFTDLGVLTPAAVSDELIKLYQ